GFDVADGFGPRLSSDELTLWFMADRSTSDIFVATRPDTRSAFGQAVPVAPLNSAAHEASPMLSSDGLSLYFSSDRSGKYEVYLATRPRADVSFVTAASVPELNASDAGTIDAYLSWQGDEIWLVRDNRLSHAFRSGSSFAAPLPAHELDGPVGEAM